MGRARARFLDRKEESHVRAKDIARSGVLSNREQTSAAHYQRLMEGNS